MSSDDLDDFWVHQVIVQTYLGTTGNSRPLYAAPVAVNGFLSRKRRLIRGANGDQVVSESSYSADAAQKAVLVPLSKVTFDANGDPFGAGTFGGDDFGGAADDGVTTTVLSLAVASGGDFIEGLDCAKAYLQ